MGEWDRAWKGPQRTGETARPALYSWSLADEDEVESAKEQRPVCLTQVQSPLTLIHPDGKWLSGPL